MDLLTITFTNRLHTPKTSLLQRILPNNIWSTAYSQLVCQRLCTNYTKIHHSFGLSVRFKFLTDRIVILQVSVYLNPSHGRDSYIKTIKTIKKRIRLPKISTIPGFKNISRVGLVWGYHIFVHGLKPAWALA